MNARGITWLLGTVALLSVLAPVGHGAPAPVAPAPGLYSASGRALMVVGPDPYTLDRTRPVQGAITLLASGLAGLTSAGWLRAEVTVGPARFTVEADALSLRTVAASAGPIPAVGPRIVAWGRARVRRGGAVVAARVPTVVTVMVDPPLRGVSLEVGTWERSVPGAPGGYLHVMWWDVDVGVPQAAAR